MTATRVPVLTYHSIDGSGSVISTDAMSFRSQISSLAAKGYTGIRADQLVAAWTSGASLPKKPVVITFDDGFANFADVAAPVLRAANFGATVFVISDFAGKSNDWPGQPSSIPRLPLMTWDAIRAMAAAGFEIGGHTATHPDLRMLGTPDLEREVVAGRKTIEDQIASSVTTFAYPYGAASAAAHDVVRRTFAGAFGTRLGTASPSSSLHELPRLDMYYYRSAMTFSLFGTPAGDAYIRARALGRAARAMISSGPKR